MSSHKTYLINEINKLGYYPYTDSTNSLTFVGALVYYFEPESEQEKINANANKHRKYISQPWDTKGDSGTIRNYVNDYIRDIIPEVEKWKKLQDYEEKDFNDIVKAIEANRAHSPISEERIKHFKSLLYAVYIVAANNGAFPYRLNELKAESVYKDLANKPETIAKQLLIPKSLPLNIERAILDEFKNCDICHISGEVLGIYLQFFTGSRNEEAAGLVYSDISEHLNDNRPLLFLTKTSPGKGTSLRLKMKTRNAYRTIPLFSFLAARLKERQEYIQKLYPNEDVSKFPIACNGNNYKKRIGTDNLSKEGKKLLLRLYNSDKDYKTDYKRMLLELNNEGFMIDEKEPTTYLLRRNFATHLHNLGLTQSEVEYIMGHEISDPNVVRNHYSSSDEIEKLYDKFEKFPFYSFFTEKKKVLVHVKNGVRVKISLKEPNDKLNIKVKSGDQNNIRISAMANNQQFTERVDISNIINPLYSENK